MAKQNFLSGGFYGKLGAMVGQRWKNKRTIRTYVVPHNPNTPEQKRNRSNFAGAVQYAQMAMQMNYYCNLFENPNFTKWNYRMSVARNLKFAGMTDLNLIPLYPTDFTPPTTITKIKVASITGSNHVTFSVPELIAQEDRAFSMMFALYNEASLFRGYKLYLGYYNKDYPQTLEVQVDDVKEINSHCFVRIVTNDDQDSSKDMIASASLAVEMEEIDRHAFDCSISMIEKSAVGFTITFAEPWRENPTVNTVSFILSFVSDGMRKDFSYSDRVLVNNNGLCSVIVPYATTYNQDLPAFPEGSGILEVDVNYTGQGYEITLMDGSASYSDSDLVRNLDRPVEHNTNDGVKVNLRIPFSGTGVAENAQMDYFTEGRFGDSSILNGLFSITSDGSYLNIRATGTDRNYPMREANCYVDVPAFDVVSNGVTYKKTAEKKYFSNDVNTSNYLIDSSIDTVLYKVKKPNSTNYFKLKAEVAGLKLEYGEVKDSRFIEKITNTDSSVVSTIESWSEKNGSAGNYALAYYGSFQNDPNQKKVTDSSTVSFIGTEGGNVNLEYNGILYDTGKSASRISEWPNVILEGKDEHEFDCGVSLIEKSVAGLKVTFKEPWMDSPSVNKISLQVSCISDGAQKVITLSDGVLKNNSGFCSVDVPYPTTYNQDLPSFPVGSYLAAINVQYEGQTYRITLSNGNSPYSDTDLVRNLDRPVAHNTTDEIKVSIRMPFSGTGVNQNVQMNFFTEGRFGDSSVLSAPFAVTSDGSFLNIRATGTYRRYPMREVNCYIDVPSFDVVSNGVTYRKTAEKKYFSNTVTVSDYLLDNQNRITLEKLKAEGVDIYPQFTITVDGLKLDFGEVKDARFIEMIENPNGTVITELEQWVEQSGSAGNYALSYYANIEQDPEYDSIRDGSRLTFIGTEGGAPYLEYNGIRYDTGKYGRTPVDWNTIV